ncbi:MAG: NADH-quinone oxidoreductase subunit NuoE [Thermodesulfobacteriota bacterium]|jgi:NADH-quinone oxidoreductase subunit E
MNHFSEKEEKIETFIQDLLRSYPKGPEILIPLLQKIQETLGFLPREAMEKVAVHLDISESEVYGVATFYNQFRFHPPGKHPVKVCMGTACHVKGATVILESWERRLNIKVGQTTADREFSLDRVACVGCCALAPVAVVGEKVHGHMAPTKVDGLLLAFQLEREGKKAP